MGESSYIDPVKDRLVVEQIIETVIRNYENTGKHFYGGAAARIKAQLPTIIMSKETLVEELDKAFTRERNCYF